MRQLAEIELADLLPQVDVLEKKLKSMLVPKDPRDDRNVIIEIRAGTGGDEAALFGAELMRMYTRFAERRNWKIEVMSINETGIGGIKEAVLLIKGKGAYSQLNESGVHRVQRVPVPNAGAHPHLHRHRGCSGRSG